MKTLLVFAHPLKEGAFNHALKEIAQETFKHLKISDLYAMHFKAGADWDDFQGEGYPLQYTLAQKEAFSQGRFAADIQQEQEKLLWCDLLLLQFPFWWFSAPALLKGWLDRVLAKGFAYDKGKWFEQGLMRGKKAKLVLTTQSGSDSYSSEGVHGPIDPFLMPLHHTLKLVGFSLEKPFIAYGVDGGSLELRKSALDHYQKELFQLTKK